MVLDVVEEFVNKEDEPPFFVRKDFETCYDNMQTCLRHKGLENWIVDGFDDPCDDAMDASSLYLIQQALDNDIFHVIAVANSAKKAWNCLKKRSLMKGELYCSTTS